jgi:hypothetical protein
MSYQGKVKVIMTAQQAWQSPGAELYERQLGLTNSWRGTRQKAPRLSREDEDKLQDDYDGRTKTIVRGTRKRSEESCFS